MSLGSPLNRSSGSQRCLGLLFYFSREVSCRKSSFYFSEGARNRQPYRTVWSRTVKAALALACFTFDYCRKWTSTLQNRTNSVFVCSSYSEAGWMLTKYFGHLGEVALRVFKILLNVLFAKYFRERFS